MGTFGSNLGQFGFLLELYGTHLGLCGHVEALDAISTCGPPCAQPGKRPLSIDNKLSHFITVEIFILGQLR